MTISTVIDRGGVFTISELGCSHAGRADVAIAMIDATARAGASAAKTQRRDIASMNPEILAQSYVGPHSFAPEDDPTYRGHRIALELTMAEQEGLASYARGLGLSFGCSAWDSKSAAEIAAANFDFIKVPSALATDLTLLAEIAGYGLPVVCSFGMCSAADVRAATEALDGAEIHGLHATSAYPLKHEDVHLRVIPALHAEYVVPRAWRSVGYSDHTPSLVTGAAAVAMGARVLEKHFTLSRVSKGTDHAASMEPDGMRRYVRDANAVLTMLGSADKAVLPCEEGSLRKLRAAHAWRK